MKSLPHSWVQTRLETALKKIVGGGTPSKVNLSFFSGKNRFMTVKDMKARFPEDTIDHISDAAISSSATTVVPADTLIVATRMSLGKIVRPKFETAINQDLKALFLADGINKTYIEYFWRSKAAAIENLGTGTTVKGIRLEDIKNLELALAPQAEQKRIADKLDAVLARVDACRDRLDRIPTILKRFRQSVLAAATSGQLTADWRKDYLRHTSNEDVTRRYMEIKSDRVEALSKLFSGKKQQDIPEIAESEWENFPSEWLSLSLGAVAYVMHGYAFESKDFGESGPIVLTPGNFTEEGNLDFKDKRVVRFTSDGYGEWVLENGSVLVVMTDLSNKKLILGKVVVLNSAEVVLHNQRIGRVALLTSQVNREFIRLAMLRPSYKKYVDDTATGTLVQHTSPSRLHSGCIPLPPLPEQLEIVRRVETLFAFADRLEARVTAARESADRLTPALLAKAFRGELVPQDPNDEPAAQLLKRLAENRAGGNNKKTKARQ